MDCCNYVPYRHHQGYYGYYNEPLPPYHGEFYGHHNMYYDYYGNINPYYSPHQHWQGSAVFAPQDYVYNPKEARLRKAMREANRDRSIGASPMLPRPSARRAGSSGWVTQGGANVPGGSVASTTHGPHEEPLMMSSMGQGMRGPGMDSPCFPTGMPSTSGSINGSGNEQFMPPSMRAATPAPGYPTTKMDQVSPLPPPPAPTPGVHAPYMQKKQESIQNIVEREKKRQVERKALISRMRKNLPTYNITQIRELRLPYHEAIFANMEEKSYVSSVAFGKELLNFQDNLRKDSPQGSVAFSKPMLQYDKEKFTLLMESLRKAEDNHRELNLIGECEEFLKLSILFAFADADDWWWLGEQLLIQTIKISSNYSSKIGNKYEALSRYIYGRYLLEKLKEFKNASVQLKISRMLSHGKGWLCKSYFPELRGTLFMQCSHGIYYCTIREVKFYMGNQDYDKAIVLAEQARKRAAEACYKNGETHALVLKGICEMETGHLKSSISSLMRAYSIQNRFGTVEGLCKIRIHLAKAYLMDKCANSSLNVLLELKRDAERYNLPYYLGLAYKNLGQYYLLIGENNKALPLLKQSLKIFKKCDSTTPAFKEIQSTETLKVISGGLQLFPKYVSLLVDVDIFGVVRSDSLKALLLWKENRTPFWSDKDHLITYNSCEDILTESVRRVCESRANFFDKNLKEIAKH